MRLHNNCWKILTESIVHIYTMEFSNGHLMEQLYFHTHLHGYGMCCMYLCFLIPFFLYTFCVADEFKAFYTRLPQNYFLNVSTIQHLWSLDAAFQWRYEQLEASMRVLSRRAQRVIFKLFSLSKRCNRQPQIHLPRERSAQNSLPSFVFLCVSVCVCVCVSRLPI